VWHCRAGNWFFEAIVPANAQAPLRLQPNAVVRLVGICELTTSHSLPRAEWVDGFRLHVRSAADIRILRFPAWWTVRRALSALAVVGVVALGLLAGTALLRRRVASQAKIIAAQTERATVRGERQRIARELHDTLEQELAGLSIQLRNARRLLADDPAQAESTLGFAQLVLRRCREEAHTSIRDLRSVTLELRGLSGALDDLLRPISATCGARFVLQIAGVPRSLPGAMEIHLLRIAHQAVTNAAQHAAPREISVRLSYEDHAVSLEIRDDGRGFDPSAEPPRGHFGLLGIRERANKLKARLDIESAPRAGTRIRLVAPVESAALTAASA
jgi:signal transduction histidine kinase